MRRELSIFVSYRGEGREASAALNALKDRIREVENEQFLSAS